MAELSPEVKALIKRHLAALSHAAGLDVTPLPLRIGQSLLDIPFRAMDAAYRGDIKGMTEASTDAALAGAGAGTIFAPRGAIAAGASGLRRAVPNEAAQSARLSVPPTEAVPHGPGQLGGTPGLEEAQRAAEAARGSAKEVAGLPKGPFVGLAGTPYIPGPIGDVHEAAAAYMKGAGLKYNPIQEYAKVDKLKAAKIAQAYEDMPHAPDDPKVQAAYNAMINETKAQYQALKDKGYTFEFIKPGQPDPYAASPRLATQDFRDNKHLWVFPTEGGFGSGVGDQAINMSTHPMMQPSGEIIDGRPALNNDLFRVVHDVYGHFQHGFGFRAEGEENAWRSHSRMYSDTARPAMTAETRGQNSWVNYGPHGEANRNASAADTVYAPQKVGVMPDWAVQGGQYEPITTPGGFAVKGPAYEKRMAQVNKELDQLPKGTGPMDINSATSVQAPQVGIPRYVPPRGVSPRLQDALNNPDVVQGVRESIQKGVEMGAHRWYHNEPVLQAFVNELGPEEGQQAFSNYMDMVAATSPKTTFPENVRNASYPYMLERQGQPLPEGKFPYPYGGPPLHRQNIENYWNGGLDVMQNPKPPSFTANLKGNLVPGTIDTHAFRNIAMRTGDKRFLNTSLSEDFKGDPKNPSNFVQRFGELKQQPDGTWKVTYRPQQLVDQGRLTMDEAKEIPTFWASKPNDNEYAAAEELYRRLGAEHGLQTAEAQSSAWAGAGELTGLGSPPDMTTPEVMNRRLEFTARMRNENPQDTLSWFIRGQKPLLGLGGAAVAAPALLNQDQQQ